MQGIIKFTYLGIDSFQGKKDPSKTYYNVSLLQGSEIAKVFLDAGQEVLFNGLEKFDEIICTVSWSLATDKYGAKINYRLHEVKPLDIELPEETTSKPDNKVTDLNQKTKTA
jgi:hypothetical protein